MSQEDPHRSTELQRAGCELAGARAAVLLLHGRGGSAEDMLSLAGSFAVRNVTYLAPAAAGSSWYPNSFLAERSLNEPWLSSALSRVQAIVDLIVAAGVPHERILLCGFSQGACLATEFICSQPLPSPARYGGLIAYTGGLIGPPGAALSHRGRQDGMPALLACGDPDPYIPWPRVQESARILSAMGAHVTLKHYPGRPHIVSAEEIDLGRTLIETVALEQR